MTPKKFYMQDKNDFQQSFILWKTRMTPYKFYMQDKNDFQQSLILGKQEWLQTSFICKTRTTFNENLLRKIERIQRTRYSSLYGMQIKNDCQHFVFAKKIMTPNKILYTTMKNKNDLQHFVFCENKNDFNQSDKICVKDAPARRSGNILAEKVLLHCNSSLYCT